MQRSVCFANPRVAAARAETNVACVAAVRAGQKKLTGPCRRNRCGAGRGKIVGGGAGIIPRGPIGYLMITLDPSPENAALHAGDVFPDMTGGTRHYVSDYLTGLHELLSAIDPAELENVVNLLFEAHARDRRVVLCGNGGSASTASHLVCDFMKNILLDGGKPFEVVALTDSPALLSAWGNDTEFANVFAGQARTWLRAGDVLIAISGSGNSLNVLRAVEVAREVGATSIGWCGYTGGKLAPLVDHAVVVRKRNMQQVEDLHLIFGHIVFSALRDRIKGLLAP